MKKLVVLLAVLLSLGMAQTQKVRVGLGYLPDVQFAPFYAGVVEGLYARRGLEVEFQHGFASELYPLLAQGRLDFVVADAEDVIALRAQGTPLKYVLALYQSVPNALFSRAEKNITSVRDLKGKTIGIPGLFGTSYTSLQAMLRAAGLRESDVKIEQIGFTQAEAIVTGRVDVAIGFINNEPIVLEARGIKLNVIPAGPYNLSPGVGVISTDRVLENAELARRFVQATQEAMALTLREPRKAFEASRKYVQNLGEDRLRVLEVSLRLYQSPYTRQNGLGFSNPQGWQSGLNLLKQTGRVRTDLPATAFYTNEFLQRGVQVQTTAQR
ncbi:MULTISPECIES: ABC transporter substrate-binding protein [Meiothermus]|uniref:Sulfonate ABC transporter substrate-binding protein n=2 Tax=Meiothermus hypogaeus TaxID=884155 RepID=A0A511R222_9DEIN|nr:MULTISPECIES: ABC transporter substrate-binding protein [Meiothermus]RIH77339.1 Riboflavin-binding protein RibY [Meiothermus hypogaeus]GEM82902.1 sulfonate ABC transporter substrate-binding protein [Meiothermus hypogaeus NBRC 106114]GIW34866.1 MAG: sulfonate ABC transporter substrate-binding protein [Meiothermus sp.]